MGLPGGRSLGIRRVVARDAAGLKALFAGLDEADLYRRFFSGHSPPESFIDRMARVEETGGIGLIAVLEGLDGSRRIVGEASCNPLPSGNGELGITVAPDARGWLGPYLLDVLVDQAARRGVANIEADVVVTNRRMLSLLHHRGCAVMDESDRPSIVRVTISTTRRVADWAGKHDKARVVIEAPGGHWRAAQALRDARFEVLVCPGPLRGWSACPALRGKPCPLAATADAIVDVVPGEPGSSLLAAHRRLHPSVPLCAELLPPLGEPASNVAVIPATGDTAFVVELLERVATRPQGDARSASSSSSR